MASCFFLLKQFDDVLIYLKSIKVPTAPPISASPLLLGSFEPTAPWFIRAHCSLVHSSPLLPGSFEPTAPWFIRAHSSLVHSSPLLPGSFEPTAP
eukprot:1196097-Prorocentrum_minimum.AAC.1